MLLPRAASEVFLAFACNQTGHKWPKIGEFPPFYEGRHSTLPEPSANKDHQTSGFLEKKYTITNLHFFADFFVVFDLLGLHGFAHGLDKVFGRVGDPLNL